jgi:hypothetical protein
VNEELPIDDFDTRDCSEIRVNFDAANTWLNSEDSIVINKAHSKDWRKDRKDNILSILRSLMEMNNKIISNATAGDIADILMKNRIVLDERTIIDCLKEAEKALLDLSKKSKKVT